MVVRTWSRKGVTPVIVSAGGWKNLSLAGMIVYAPTSGTTDNLAWVRRSSVNKESIVRMLADIKRKYEQGSFVLFWDGLPVHRSKPVKKFIEANNTWLTVHRFPAYAPELNPQEGQWSSLKRKDLGNYCPPTMEALATKVRRGIRRMRRNDALLKGFLLNSKLWTVKELGEGQ